MEESLKEITSLLQALLARTDVMSAQLNSLDTRMGALEKRVDVLEKKVDRLCDDMLFVKDTLAKVDMRTEALVEMYGRHEVELRLLKRSQ